MELLCVMEKVVVRKQKKTISEEEKESLANQDQGTHLVSSAYGGTSEFIELFHHFLLSKKATATEERKIVY